MPESAIESLRSLLHLPVGAGDPLADLLRFSGTDPELTRRLLLATAVAAALSLVFWFLDRTSDIWLGWIPGRRRRRVWEAELKRRGLGPEERALVLTVARQAEVEEVEELLRSRVSFESAVRGSQSWIDADPRRLRALDQVRRRLSWESAPAPRPDQMPDLLDHNLEVEVFGAADTAGFCVRATLVHRDVDAVVLRLEREVEGVPWREGSTVRVYFWRENDAGYLFDTPVIEVRDLGEMFLFVKPPRQLERHQRRLHVRVPIEAPVTFLRIPNGEAVDWLRGEREEGDGPLCSGVVEDLSAGGFRIRAAQPLQIGDFLSFAEFPVVDDEEVLARVIAAYGEEPTESERYGVQFLGVSAPQRARVARHVFRLQRQIATGQEWSEGRESEERRPRDLDPPTRIDPTGSAPSGTAD
jgi:c-di-GMP-binding flagellar brake protein YcgR